MSNALIPTSFSEMQNQAKTLVASGLLPEAIKRPEQAIAIMQKGAELGIPPMQAFSHIHIIKGKPTMSAELMLAQIYKGCPNAVINYLELDEKKCVIEAIRPGHKPARFGFSMGDAEKAGLLSNQTWKKYPRAMLRSRCISEMARSLFPDCISGVSYTAEELGATVNDEGEVLDVTPEPTKALPVEPCDQIYTGDPDQKREMMAMFKNYNVPQDKWAEISQRLIDEEIVLRDCEVIVYNEYSPAKAEAPQ